MMLGWCHVILEEKLYKEDFLKQWTNGSFLVRADNGKMLRETDIVKDKGDRSNFVAWDLETQKPAVWLSGQNKYREDGIDNALEGEYEVQLSDGKKVKCRTAFTLLMERIAEYTPEKVSEITTVPVDHIREAARMYATNGPATIGWGVGSCDQSGWNASYAGLAKTLLRSFTENMDVPGGDYLGEPGPLIEGEFPVRDSQMELSERVTPEAKAKFLGNDQFRLMSWNFLER